METLNTDIVRFRFLGRPAYFVTGDTATAPVFRHNSGLSSEDFSSRMGRVMFGSTDKDSAVIDQDRSGRGKEPLPGTGHYQRFFAPWHNVLAENLLRTKPTNDLTAMYLDNGHLIAYDFDTRSTYEVSTDLFPLQDFVVRPLVH